MCPGHWVGERHPRPVSYTHLDVYKRQFEGKLESFEDGKLLLDLSEARKKKLRPKEGDSSKVEIELTNVEKANLVPEI